MAGIRLREAVSIGIGGMVGGGIFAVLGVAVAQSGPLAWASFFVGGVVAMLTAYAFWRLGATVPSPGGAVEYINRAFGENTFTGGVNWLLWIGYSLMVAVYAFAFGAYGASLVPSAPSWLPHVFSTVVIVAFVGLNLLGAGDVGRAEDVLVLVKLVILGVFIVAGVTAVHPGTALHGTAGPFGVLAGGMVVFLAYEGFELIGNAVGDMDDPRRTLPRALFISTGFVTALYVAIAFIAVASLAPAQIIDAQEYALARAAEPALGHTGFVLIAVAAILATAGAINSTLYGTQRVVLTMAMDNEVPEVLEGKPTGRHATGLFVTAGVSLALVNLVPLQGLAILSSTVFLIVFALVNAAAFRLHALTGARRLVTGTAMLACLGSLAAVLYVGRNDTQGMVVLAAILVAAFGAEALYQRFGRPAS